MPYIKLENMNNKLLISEIQKSTQIKQQQQTAVHMVLANCTLTLKSYKVAKFIAVVSSALGTVFLGKLP